jgi:hypothetical protein
MPLNEEEIRSLSEWQCLVETPPPLSQHHISEDLSKRLGTAVSVRQLDSAESGLSNYDSLFISLKANQQGKCQGILLYTSSLSKIAAISEATIYFAHGAYSYSGIEPDQLLEPKDPSTLVGALSALLLKSGYHLISKAEALVPLPNGVQPYEYCLSKEPWNKVFHVLFSNTD